MSLDFSDACPICGASLEIESVVYTQSVGVGAMIVKNVPAAVCPKCGEKSFDLEIFQKVIELKARMNKTHLKNAIYDFEDINI